MSILILHFAFCIWDSVGVCVCGGANPIRTGSPWLHRTFSPSHT